MFIQVYYTCFLHTFKIAIFGSKTESGMFIFDCRFEINELHFRETIKILRWLELKPTVRKIFTAV